MMMTKLSNRTSRLALLLPLISFIVSGCVTSSPDAIRKDGPTTWQSVMTRLTDARGRATPELALEAFSLAIAPVPGGERAAPDGDAMIPSGSLAIALVAQQWPQLSGEQRAAVSAAVPELGELGVVSRTDPVSEVSPITPASRSKPSRAAQPADAEQAHGSRRIRNRDVIAQQSIVDAVFTFFIMQSGLTDPGWRPVVEAGTTAGASVYASTTPGGSACRVEVDLAKLGRNPPGAQHFLLAHEAFHCVDGLNAGGPYSQSPWVFEGLAMWAAYKAPLDSSGPVPADYYVSPLAPDFWNGYLTSPDVSLFSRAYDAFPFYVYLESRGVDVWHTWPTIPDDDRGAFSAFTGGLATVTDWPSGHFREPVLGAAWDVPGPHVPPFRSRAVSESLDLPNGLERSVGTGPGEVGFALYDVTADVVDIGIAGTGHARFADGTELAGPGAAGTFCAREDACACPEGTTPVRELDVVAPGPLRFAVTGGADPGTGTVEGRAFDIKTDCTKSPTAGVWKLAQFTVDATELGLVYSPTGGTAELDVADDGVASIRMAGATFAVEFTGALQGLHTAAVDGVSTGVATFDEDEKTVSWTADSMISPFVITLDGHAMTEGDLGGLPAFSPPPGMTYSSAGTTMTWRHTEAGSDGGTLTWTWVR